MSYTYKYPRPAVTADVVAITKEEEPKVDNFGKIANGIAMRIARSMI